MVKGIITEKIASHLLTVCLESFQINSVIKKYSNILKLFIFLIRNGPFCLLILFVEPVSLCVCIMLVYFQNFY